jgi:hypothetical protein
MFKNRALQVKVIKTQPKPTPPTLPERSIAHIEKLNDLAMKTAKSAAVGFVAVYAAVKVLNTASEIAVNAAPKR